MRSILAILLLCCYTISTCGIVISKHYCAGELETISFYKKVASCCCGEEEEMKTAATDDCCQDVVSFSKLKTDQIVKDAKIVLVNNYLFHAPIQYFIFANNCSDIAVQSVFIHQFTHPPPDDACDKLYLKYVQLKLYDVKILAC